MEFENVTEFMHLSESNSKALPEHTACEAYILMDFAPLLLKSFATLHMVPPVSIMSSIIIAFCWIAASANGRQ